MKLARLFIARVFLLFSFSVSSSVRGDEAADISHIRGTLDILNEYVQADQMQFLQGWKQSELQALQNVVPVEYQDRVLKSLVGRGIDDTFTWSDSDNIRAYLKQLTASVYGNPGSSLLPGTLLYNSNQSLTQLYAIRNLLAAVSNNLVSSSSSGGTDVLAGNPWWATNSAFALVANNYSQVYPDDGQNLSGILSFPQFMSKWSAKLSAPAGSGSLTSDSAFALWGLGSFRQWGSSNQQGFTWFDWVSDAMRSNLVAQGHSVRTLDSILAASLNSGGSTNIVNVWVTNIVGGVTNILRADDILAANPWWATNSGFVTDYYRMTRNGAYPPSAYPHDSFPVFASQLASTIYQPNISDYPYSSDYMTRWGRDGANWNNGVYTWFDWVSDYLRSNLVLTTSPNATNIDDELYLAGYDTDTSDTITNTPLPEYSLPSSETIPEAENVLQQGEQTVTSFIESLPQPGTGGDPEIVLIPEFTIGGIHVREHRASLSSPIVPTCHAVLSFLYAVGLACYVFKMAKSEYVYYATIGRQWGRYD